MTATDVETKEGTEMAATEFNPALVTSDQVVGLTKKECAAVLEHYKLPKVPASWQLSDFRRLAFAAVIGHEAEQAAAAPPASGSPDSAEPETAAAVDDEPVDASGSPDSEPGTALEAHRPAGLETFPDPSRWQQITSMSHALAKSGIVPEALRGKPDDITVVLLAAHDLGIAPTQALNKVHVIKGKPGLAAELMVALALRDGHSITPDPDNDRSKATVHYRRRDNGDSGSVSFTIDEAVDAKLVEWHDGKLRAVKGKDTWVQFTADMLWARAVSRLMRRVFPDALAGISYTPDELGYIDADDDPVRSPGGRHGEATVTLNERRQTLSERAKNLRPEEKRQLVEEWRVKNYPKTLGTGPENPARPDFTALSPAAITALDRFIDGLLAARGPGDDEPTDPGAGEPQPDPGAGDSSESPDPAQEQPVGADDGAAAVPEPENAPGAAEGVSDPVSPAEAGSIPDDGIVDAELVEEDGSAEDADASDQAAVVDVDELCDACQEPIREGQPTEVVDGKRYHAGHEPF